jgi:hypothetical protein
MPLRDRRRAFTRKNCLSWVGAAAMVTPTPAASRPNLSPTGSDHLRYPTHSVGRSPSRRAVASSNHSNGLACHCSCSRLMWFLADVIGPLSDNVVSFSSNVVPGARIFSANLVPKTGCNRFLRFMLSGRYSYLIIYVVALHGDRAMKLKGGRFALPGPLPLPRWVSRGGTASSIPGQTINEFNAINQATVGNGVCHTQYGWRGGWVGPAPGTLLRSRAGRRMPAESSLQGRSRTTG